MQRFLTLVVLSLLTIPVGLSLQGCANKNSNYCNGSGYGYLKSQPVSIILQPQTTGLSVAFSQTSQLQSPTAQNCNGGSASIGTYTYGTTDRTIADVSPTGAVCGGTWNLHTPAVAAYTTCLPTNKTGVAYMTASAAGFTSNQVAVYSHPPHHQPLRSPARPTAQARPCVFLRAHLAARRLRLLRVDRNNRCMPEPDYCGGPARSSLCPAACQRHRHGARLQ